MKTLKNKTLLVGRENGGQSRLVVALNVNGKMKVVTVEGLPQVPNSVSRCLPDGGVAHLQIAIDANGEPTVKNLKEANVTYVDGVAVESKRISAKATFELGPDRFKVSLERIVAAAKKVIGVDISGLEVIWNKYKADTNRISIKQQTRARRRMLPLIIGSVSGIIAPILANVKELGSNSLFITVPISLISLIIYIKNYNEKDTSIVDKDKLNEKFMDEYVCPACKEHFFGFQPYKLVRKIPKCPRCQADFITE